MGPESMLPIPRAKTTKAHRSRWREGSASVPDEYKQEIKIAIQPQT